MELKLADKYKKIFPLLNEKQRRLVAASDAEFIGRGGIVKVSQASGMSRSTISIGMKELQSGSIADALQSKGHKISHNAVRMILKRQGYSLQPNRKTHEGGIILTGTDNLNSSTTKRSPI